MCPPPFRLKFTSVTNSQPCHWSHAGPTRTASLRLTLHPLSLSLSHTHTHTLSLSRSLSLSLRQWDNNHAHRPSSSTVRVLTLGHRSEIDLITLSNSRADSNSAIQLAAPVRQWAFSSLLSHSPISLLQSFPCLGNPIHILSNRTSQGVLIRSVQPPPEEYRPSTQLHHHGTQHHTRADATRQARALQFR